MDDREEPPETAEQPEDQQRPSTPTLAGGALRATVLGLGQQLRLDALTERHSSVVVLGAFAAVNGLISIGLMSLAAFATGSPLIFPSLGPTAFLLFYTPLGPAASPRNTLYGHLVGALAGYLALAMFGLLDAPFEPGASIEAARVGSAAVSLGLTSGAMVWLRSPHPPAGATTLIVALGILREPWQLAVLMLAVVLLVGQGFVINRLAGIPYPTWGTHQG